MANLPPREPPDLRGRGNRPGGTGPLQPPPGGMPQYPPDPSGLPPNQAPRLGGQPGYPPQPPPYQQGYQAGYEPYDPSLPPADMPPRRGFRAPIQAGYNVFNLPAIAERRIEYLAWGTVVLVIGFSIIFITLDPDAALEFLRVGTPLAVGTILLFSALLQRIGFGYAVSMPTWWVANFSLAFGLSQFIAITTDSEPMRQLIYFVGFLVIITGIVIILQVFRPQHS
jgi:hypothetical protein